MTEKTQSLGNKVVSGSFWIVALEISNQLLQFLKTFIAANILTPEDFGVVGIAFLIIVVIEVISTTGMREALIQKRLNPDEYLSTVWLIDLGKGILVTLLAIGIAPILGKTSFLSNSEYATYAIVFIGAIFFFKSALNSGVVLFEKNMQFKSFFIYQFAGTLVDVIVSIVLVLLYMNIWSLFFGYLAGSVVRFILSFVLTKDRPHFSFSFTKAKELFQFGKWVFRGRLFSFIVLQSDTIIVSAFFPIYHLGIYQMAFRIGNLPMNQVSNVIGRLSFPLFSQFQDDLLKVRRYFLMSLNLMIILLFPLTMLVFCLIKEFTILFLGEKWIEIVPIVQVLILSGLLRVMVALLDRLFSAIGDPKTSSQMQFTRLIIFAAIVIPLGYYWGILGIALSGLMSLGITALYFLKRASTTLGIRADGWKYNVVVPSLLTLLIGATLFSIKEIFPINLSMFLLLILATLSGYVGLGLALQSFVRINLFENVLAAIKHYRSGF